MSLLLNGTDGVTYNDGTLQSSAPVGRNRIINGNMQIAQRGTAFAGVTNGTYTLDRFSVTQVGAGVATINQASDSPTAAEAGIYNTKCLEVDVTTADTSVAASDLYAIVQEIEGNNIIDAGFGQAGTRNVTVSFWVKTNKTGIYCLGLTNANWGALERDYTAEYTVSSADTWEKKTITIPVDTTGTWGTGTASGLSARFCLYSGSNFHITKDTWVAGSNVYAPSTSNQVNLFDNISNYFKVSLIQLETGTTATDFEHLQYGQQLALCQRYYEKSYNYATALGTATLSNAIQTGGTRGGDTTLHIVDHVTYLVQKRAGATVSLWDPSGNAGKVTRDRYGEASFPNTTPYIQGAGENRFIVYSTGDSAQSMSFHYQAVAEL
jgi:hypothetical protein